MPSLIGGSPQVHGDCPISHVSLTAAAITVATTALLTALGRPVVLRVLPEHGLESA
jgi:hypothetical protein